MNLSFSDERPGAFTTASSDIAVKPGLREPARHHAATVEHGHRRPELLDATSRQGKRDQFRQRHQPATQHVSSVDGRRRGSQGTSSLLGSSTTGHARQRRRPRSAGLFYGRGGNAERQLHDQRRRPFTPPPPTTSSSAPSAATPTGRPRNSPPPRRRAGRGLHPSNRSSRKRMCSATSSTSDRPRTPVTVARGQPRHRGPCKETSLTP